MNIESLVKRQILRRKVDGMAAALQPFKDHGRIAVEAFQRHLVNTHRAGLMNAVNMDTGYVNYLSDTEKQDVLRWTRDALGKDMPFIAGWVHRGPVRRRCLAVSPANTCAFQSDAPQKHSASAVGSRDIARLHAACRI